MVDRGGDAQAFFEQGYNCAQAVMMAYCEGLGLEPKMAARLTNCLGGGFSGTGGLCGAVSAAGLVISGHLGREDAEREGESLERQKQTYALVRRMQADFKDAFGDLNCPALVKRGFEASGELRDGKFLCPQYVRRAAELCDAALESAENRDEESR